MKKQAVKTKEELRQAEIDNNFTVNDRIEVLRWIMSNKLGRKFIWWFLAEAKIFSSTFTSDREMAFAEGKRALGLKVLQMAQAGTSNRKLFNTMQEENIKQRMIG